MNGVNGSHPIEERGDKIVIRRLELFSGFDPSIDDGTDEEIAKFDRKKVSRIVDRTRQFISRKQHPRIVILHGQEDHSEPKEAVGAVLEVDLEDRNGVPFIVGDVEMSKDDFASYIASNKFPRRSAEIWSDDHMSEIALLGRDTPRRPLPDTRFSKQGDKVVFSMSATHFEAAPGAGNVFVPGAAEKKKESNMADEAKDEKDEMGKMMAEMKADIDRLKEENRKMYNATCAEKEDKKDEMEEDEDEDEKDEKDSKMENSKTFFAREKAKFERRIAALERDLAKERFSRDLDAMENEGFAVACCRDEMLDELVAAKNPERKLAFWRENFRRDPVNVRINQSPRSGLSPAPVEITRETVAKLVAQADGDPEKFKTLMSKAKAGSI